MKRKTEFYREDAGVCPRCKSEGVTYLEFNQAEVHYNATCDNCGLEFQEVYSLEYKYSRGEDLVEGA